MSLESKLYPDQVARAKKVESLVKQIKELDPLFSTYDFAVKNGLNNREVVDIIHGNIRNLHRIRSITYLLERELEKVSTPNEVSAVYEMEELKEKKRKLFATNPKYTNRYIAEELGVSESHVKKSTRVRTATTDSIYNFVTERLKNEFDYSRYSYKQLLDAVLAYCEQQGIGYERMDELTGREIWKYVLVTKSQKNRRAIIEFLDRFEDAKKLLVNGVEPKKQNVERSEPMHANKVYVAKIKVGGQPLFLKSTEEEDITLTKDINAAKTWNHKPSNDEARGLEIVRGRFEVRIKLDE